MCCHDQEHDHYQSHGCCCHPPVFHGHTHHSPLHKTGHSHDECCGEQPETGTDFKAELEMLKMRKAQIEKWIEELGERLKGSE